MHMKRGKKKTCFVVMLFLVIFPLLAMAASADNAAAPQPPDLSVKCGECPCSNLCSQQLPPPSPPPPPPPPPKCATPSRPPATPPPPRFVYFSGLSPPPPPPTRGWNYYYPTDNPFDLKIYSGALRRRSNGFVSGAMFVMVMIGCGILLF